MCITQVLEDVSCVNVICERDCFTYKQKEPASMNLQPLDLNPHFNALVERFGDGRSFTQPEAALLLGRPIGFVKRLLPEIKRILSDVPEAPQLHITRGIYGGHRFVSVDAGE
jgi:hypothetical protein